MIFLFLFSLAVSCDLEPVYRFSPQKLPWLEAHKSCDEWGGKLGFNKDWQNETNTDYWGEGDKCTIINNGNKVDANISICAQPNFFLCQRNREPEETF